MTDFTSILVLSSAELQYYPVCMVGMYPHDIAVVVVLVGPIIFAGVGRWRYLVAVGRAKLPSPSSRILVVAMVEHRPFCTRFTHDSYYGSDV